MWTRKGLNLKLLQNTKTQVLRHRVVACFLRTQVLKQRVVACYLKILSIFG